MHACMVWTSACLIEKNIFVLGIGNFFQKFDASNGENSCEPDNDNTSITESSTPSSEVVSLEPNNDTTSSTQSSKTGSGEPSSEIISLEDWDRSNFGRSGLTG
jgi:cytoskeletal protein RodZ